MASGGYFFALVMSALFAILFIYWGIQLWKIGNKYAQCKKTMPSLPGEKDGPSAGWAKAGAIVMWLTAISPVIVTLTLLAGGVASAFGVKGGEQGSTTP